LFSPQTQIYDTFLFSETKEYLEAVREKYTNMVIQPVTGGTYQEYHLVFGASPKWKYHSTHTYYTLPISPFFLEKMKPNERVKEHDIYTLQRLYDALYTWLERWMRERENQPCIIMNTGDIESALLIAFCRLISSQSAISPPIVYRVVLSQEERGELDWSLEKSIRTEEETLREHTIVVSPDDLRHIVEQFTEKCPKLVSKWMPPYLVSKHLAKSEGNVGYLLCSSFSDLYLWEKSPYSNIMGMETANNHLFGTILPSYIQIKNEMCSQANPNIVCETPIYQRALVDILFQFSAETRFQWIEKGRNWKHELYEQITHNTFSPDEQWNKWECWWNNGLDTYEYNVYSPP